MAPLYERDGSRCDANQASVYLADCAQRRLNGQVGIGQNQTRGPSHGLSGKIIAMRISPWGNKPRTSQYRSDSGAHSHSIVYEMSV
jgi:hypothetical protein